MAAQFPRLAGRPVTPFRSTGTVNAIYRLGDDLYARLPRVARWARDLETESHWLPRLAPGLSLRVPEPVAWGRPGEGYPWSWAIYRWIDGQPYADELIPDERQAARDLAGFVTGLRRADTAGAPRAGRRPLRELDTDTRAAIEAAGDDIDRAAVIGRLGAGPGGTRLGRPDADLDPRRPAAPQPAGRRREAERGHRLGRGRRRRSRR